MNVQRFNDNRITLIHGDCLEVMPRMKVELVDMVFADLPYGSTANKWDSLIDLPSLWQGLFRISKPLTPFVFTANGRFQYTLYNSQPDLFRYDWIWDKVIPSGMSYARFQPMRQHEAVLMFARDTPRYNAQMSKRDKPIKSGGQKNLNTGSTTLDNYKIEGFAKTYDEKNPTTIIPFMKVRKNSKHRTQKPVELVEYLIKTYTNEDDLVFDPSMGSGTTAVACINTNRRFIGIELDAEIFGVAMQRVTGDLD